MLFVVTSLDKPGHIETRLANRPEHLAWIAANQARIKAGGPFVDDDGAMCGSMLIVEAGDRAALDTLIAGDPYAKAGLFESVAVRGWRWVVNPPAG